MGHPPRRDAHVLAAVAALASTIVAACGSSDDIDHGGNGKGSDASAGGRGGPGALSSSGGAVASTGGAGARGSGGGAPDATTAAGGHADAVAPVEARAPLDATVPSDAESSTPDGGPTPLHDASRVDAGVVATLRVHYPAGGHTMTVRGSAPALSWTQSRLMTASGDTFTYEVYAITAAAEWKPVLDDATPARGPNYRVAPGETVDVWPHFVTTAGQVTTLIASFHSTTLDDDRPIYAYLPPSYSENPLATFPVVYMHDGQNLWAALPQLAAGPTWNVDTAFDAAAENGACSTGGVVGWGAQPLGGTPVTCTSDGDCPSRECRTYPEAIVIGVGNNPNRIYEYTPTSDPGTPGGGGADAYLGMLVNELKPAVDAMLRTRPEAPSTAIAGSSLGGLVTAYAGTTHADVFSRVAALSPSAWWNNGVIVTDVQAMPAAPRPLLVYVDSGQGTADDEVDTALLAAAYRTIGYVDARTLRHVIQPGGQHSEFYWAQRFPGAMQFVLGAR